MLKKIVALFVSVCFLFAIVGCGNSKYLCPPERKNASSTCREYEQIGLFELDEMEEDIEYELVAGNVVWSILLIETIIGPLILLGWYLYEPVGVKKVR